MKKSFLPDFRRETIELIKKYKIPISSIVKIIGVSQGTAYNWKDGKKSPSRKNFERLTELASGMNRQEKIVPVLAGIQDSDIIRLPVFGTVPAGPPEDALQEAMDFFGVPRGALKGNPKNSFILYIRGNSMAPALEEGDMIVVNPNITPLKGEAVVAKIDGGFTVKLWTGDPQKLMPLNPDHKEVCAVDECQVVGVVVIEMKVSRVRKLR